MKTTGGLGSNDLVKNKRGNIVSKAVAEASKKSPWIISVMAARKALNIKGFVPIARGGSFWRKAMSIHKKNKKEK